MFTFGDAGFYGSLASTRLDQPVVAITPTPDGHGYWLAAADGGVFTLGDAGFQGSAAVMMRAVPVTGIIVTGDLATHNIGYQLVSADGALVSAFGAR